MNYHAVYYRFVFVNCTNDTVVSYDQRLLSVFCCSQKLKSFLQRWTYGGRMLGERYYHTASVLANGNVLIIGGYYGGYRSTAELYDLSTGTWKFAGSMKDARYRHTASILMNGKVLVAGGSNSSSYLSSALLYDPITGNWTTTGNMSNSRNSHTASLLINGKVLVTGGIHGLALNSSELYDPTTGTWTTTGSMNYARFYHTASVLTNGKVLVTGGLNNDALNSAELYDPSTETWTITGRMNSERYYHTASILTDGKVLVTGGYYAGTLNDAELYDPSTETWTIVSRMKNAREGHTASLLTDGKVLVAGGKNGNYDYLNSSELYDPSTGTWAMTYSMNHARCYHTASVLTNGKVLSETTTITTTTSPLTIITTTSSLTTITTTTTLVSTTTTTAQQSRWSNTSNLNQARSGHTASVWGNGKVLVSGGYKNGALTSAELYDPSTDTWTTTGNMTYARYHHTATVLTNGKVLVSGGTNDSALNTAELYDPSTGTWTTTGNMNYVRYYHTSSLLTNGKVLVTGGDTNVRALNTTELYDPSTETWTTTTNMNYPRRYHTASILTDGKVLVAGGDSDGAGNIAEFYDLSSGTWTITDTMVNGRYFHIAAVLTNGKVLVSGGFNAGALNKAELYDPLTRTWTSTNRMNYARYHLRASVLTNGKVLVTGGNAGRDLNSAELYDPSTETWIITGYRDYDQPVRKVTDFSGYTTDMNKISTFLKNLRPDGGGDTPEATKTALNKALDMNLVDSNTLYQKLGCKVFPIINSTSFGTASFYILLSEYTQGKTLFLRNTDVKTISKVTINLFLSLYNAEYEPTDLVQCLSFTNIDLSAFQNENDAQYNGLMYLPDTKWRKLASIHTNSFKVEPIQFMTVNLRFMLNKFEKDDPYKCLVYEILESLMIPQHILALTSNTILGLLWRVVCKQKKDHRTDQLIKALSQTLNTMSLNPSLSADTAIIRAWIEESYNSKEEIMDRIAEIKEHVPAIVLTLDKKMTRNELLEITRSCNSDVLRTVMKLLNHLTIVTNKSNLPENYLPLNLNDNEIFELLPHLLAEGLKFSLRPAAIMAMLCVLSKNAILQERAIRFLVEIKDKWIDFELPENNAYAFSKICVKLPEFFTEDEYLHLKKLHILGGLKINAATHITIQQPFSPKVKEIHHDIKIQCKSCNIIRSTTLFPDVGKSCCALCLPIYNLKDIPEPCTNDYSHLAECSKCACLYAVVQYEKLVFSAAKCHYCRKESRVAPYRRCTVCQNKYVHYDSTETKPNFGEEYTFICAECQHATTSKTIVNVEIDISTLMDQNKKQLYKYLNIKVKDDTNIFSNELSLFKLKDIIEIEHTKDVSISSLPLINHQKPILNPTVVYDQIMTWIQSGQCERVTCYICCNDVARAQIDDTCGNKLCCAEACTECLTSWYQDVKPGCIVLVTHLLCPFCKHAPNGKILKKYNKQACTILRADKRNDIDEHWYYAWCIDCYKVKKAQEKICNANGEIPMLTNFMCDDCTEIRKNSKTKSIKYCPGLNGKNEICGVAISKKDGCNHITCTACYSHWCWLCIKTYGDHIYEHLTEVH
ncbi:unnamed protein product, partial [Rotaria sordida]